MYRIVKCDREGRSLVIIAQAATLSRLKEEWFDVRWKAGYKLVDGNAKVMHESEER